MDGGDQEAQSQTLTEWLLEHLDAQEEDRVSLKDRLHGKDLTLDQWLDVFLNNPEQLNDLSRYCFPGREHLDEFIQRIDLFSEAFIYRLLFRLLPNSCSFPAHDRLVYFSLYHQLRNGDQRALELLSKVGYLRSNFISVREGKENNTLEGCTWVIGLLPQSVNQALSALESYGLAHLAFLPDGAIYGFFNALEIIRAKFIGVPRAKDEYLNVLKGLAPRHFENLTEALYHCLGYQTELTAPSKDGGRDVIARKVEEHDSEIIVVECKRYTDRNVGIAVVQRLRGVAAEVQATRAVIVTTTTLTSEARKVVAHAPILNYLDGSLLVQKLNEHFGPRWPLSLTQILLESERRQQPQRLEEA